MVKKNALVIGGTGIIGVPVIMQLIIHNEYVVHSVSLEKASNPILPDSVNQHLVDRRTQEFDKLINKLNAEVDVWDIVIDLIAFDAETSEKTYRLVKNHVQHYITISTSLVYDRSNKRDEPIREDTPFAKEGMFGGY